MTISFVLGTNPKWYFVANNGKPLSGGKFYAYESSDKSVFKYVYSTASNHFPYPNPAIIDANGTLGPLFFEVDSTDPDDTYYLEVKDANGNLVWSMDDYTPGGGGGGGNVTTVLNLENLIINPVFYRHTDTIISPVPLYSIIAPSNFTGLVAYTGNTPATDNPSPDIVFLKDNTSATDTITFPLFILGNATLTADYTPVDYFNYTVSVAGSGELVKVLQFPISAKVQNLSGQVVNGSFWAKSSSSSTVLLRWFQYFGDGAGASTPVATIIGTFPLTTAWQKINFTTTIPSVSGKTLGGGAILQGPNDGLFIRMQMPMNATCSIDTTKLTLYLGLVTGANDYISYDYIDSIISLPRCGDARTSLNAFAPYGWVACNDGVLSNGNPAIVPPFGVPVGRNNNDTYALYTLIWQQTSATPWYANIYDSAGLVTTRGASAIADFSASKQLSLTKQLGRVIAGDNPSALGVTKLVVSAQNDGSGILQVNLDSTLPFPNGQAAQFSTVSGVLPTGLTAATIYYLVNNTTNGFIIATTLANSIASIYIPFVDVGTNPFYMTTQVAPHAIGSYEGDDVHGIRIAEMPAHNHPGSYWTYSTANFAAGGSSTGYFGGGAFGQAPVTVASQGDSEAMSLLQPTVYMNVFLKL